MSASERQRPCQREDDVLEAIAANRLRSGSSESAAIEAGELRAHLESCPSCAELVDVAAALLDDRTALMRSAELPGSGLVWWRASLRAKREDARLAIGTARLVQVALVLFAMTIAALLLGPALSALHLPAFLASARSATFMVAVPLLAIAAWLILVPVALYLVLTED